MNRNDTHIPFLDHIRGFAILIVFVFHCLGAAYGFDQLKWDGWFRDFDVPRSFLMLLPASFGWTGVLVFFVVSGFCIQLSYQRSSQKDILTFFTRRFFRIYPPYFIALLIFSFLYPWHTIRFDSLSSFSQFGSHLFLIHNFDNRSVFGINSSFWSIAVEFQLYLLYPLLILLVRRLTWTKTLWIIGALEFGMRAFAGIYTTIYDASLPSVIINSPLYFWFSWSIGAAAAEAFLNRQSLPFSRVPVWVFPLLMTVSTFIRPLAPFSSLFAACSTVSLINLLFRISITDHSTRLHFAGKHLRFVGIVSYSVYLIHQPIIGLAPLIVVKLNPNLHLHPLFMFVLCCATWIPIVMLSWCFYRLFELPSIKVGKMAIQRKIKANTLLERSVGGS